MKYFLFFCLLTLGLAGGAQTITDSSFRAELLTIVNDARAGFPKATGSAKEEENWRGQEFNSRWGFFGLSSDASLDWQRAQVYKYAKAAPVPERFYFYQYFRPGTPGAAFVSRSGEQILSQVGADAGLSKVEVKQDKKNRKKYREVKWTNAGRTLFSLFLNLEDSSASFTVNSPYRPGGKVVPNLLGCMIFTTTNFGFMYVMPVYGARAPDKETLGARTLRASGLASEFRYTWYPGRSSESIEKEFGKAMTIRLLNEYHVD